MADTISSPTKLVRIKPNVARRLHVLGGYSFEKARGWHEVPAAVAELCAIEPVSDLQAEGPLLFDVKDKDEATRIAETEAKKTNPAGTPDRPVVPEMSPRRRAPGDGGLPR